MGADKPNLLLGGVSLAVLISSRLAKAGYAVTVCGNEPLEGCAFIRDAARHAGPFAALAEFEPTAPYVFVAACDLPRFDPSLVPLLRDLIGTTDAAVPNVAGRLQPLAALYTAGAFPVARQIFSKGGRSLMSWLDSLAVRQVQECELLAGGVAIDSLSGANTPEEFMRLTRPTNQIDP